VNVSKSSLVNMLLEVGEENAAVLLARSALPDEIDTDHDLDALVAFGMDRDQVDEIARLTIGALDNRPRCDETEQTISRRWADLVDHWLT
jgi:hypothetical protein